MKTFIKDTVIKAGEEILKFYGSSTVLYSKQSITDVVTEADLASNAYICAAIKGQFPDHGIVSEEGEGYQMDSDYLWYIDPLDGTKNFSTHTPLFGINIALTHKGEVVAAAIYLPITQELCFAEKGKGAFLNDVKILCSSKEDWKGSYGVGTIKSSKENLAFLKQVDEISEHTCWTNAIASSAVSGFWVSSGKRDWYIAPGKNAWDYAATSLIASEAGALVTNFSGTPYKPGDRGLVVANPHLHPKLLQIVKESYNC